jgi:hypothetical protein
VLPLNNNYEEIHRYGIGFSPSPGPLPQMDISLDHGLEEFM